MIAVGVIGVGAMGLGVVESLRRGGYTTYVHDIVAERMQLAEKFGAMSCASPAALARSAQVIILLVVNAEQVDAVLFGKQGVAASLGQGDIVIASSTLDPKYVASLATRLAAQQIMLLDAPVSGGPARAAAGTMTMMVSGEKSAHERCATLLSNICGKVFQVGAEAGLASKVKLVNNLLAGINLAASAEAMALAIQLGIDAKLIFDVVNESSGASWVFRDRMARVLEGDYEPRAALPILTKDLSLALALAEGEKFPLPLGQAAHEIFSASSRSVFGTEDDAALIKYYQSLSGIELPKAT